MSRIDRARSRLRKRVDRISRLAQTLQTAVEEDAPFKALIQLASLTNDECFRFVELLWDVHTSSYYGVLRTKRRREYKRRYEREYARHRRSLKFQEQLEALINDLKGQQ